MTPYSCRLLVALTLLHQAMATASNSPQPAPPCFPASIDGLESVPIPDGQAESLKAYRNTRAAGYNGAAYGIAVSAFIYDRELLADDSAELEAAISEILSVRPGAELAGSGKGKLPVAGTPTTALGAMFLWTENEMDYGSFLWLVPGEKQYLKIRTTYIRPQGDREAVEAMESAISAIETVSKNVCRPD
jgi:hypothetical protein